MEEKLICLQSKVDNPPNIDAQSSSSDGKRKSVVTRTVNVLQKQLEKQFIRSEP